MRLRLILGFVTGVVCLALAVPVAAQTQSAYALVLANADGTFGPNLRPAAVDCATLREKQARPFSAENLPCNLRQDVNRFSASGLPWDDFVRMLAVRAGRIKIEDRTGLSGLYDWDLTYTPPQLIGHPPDRFQHIDPNGPTVFTAVEQQLGLRLVPLN